MSRESKVEEILEKRIKNGRIEYFVKWVGLKISESTWEPEENLPNSKNLIKEYLSRETLTEEKYDKKHEKVIENPAQNNNPAYQTRAELMKYEDIPIIYDLSGDIPKKIRSVKKINEELHSLVEFEERSDGLMTEPCYVPSLILRKTNPKLLIEFYESKIKFVSKK